MASFIGFFKIIRPLNLLFIVLAQFLVRYAIILPAFEIYNIEPTLNFLNFSLLVLSTVLIAAGGYVINDYFDVKIDYLNKPKKVFIDNNISRKTAMKAHVILSVLGVISGIYLSYIIGNFSLSIIFPVVAGLLWFYSTTYKKQALIGNFIVSFLTGLILLMVVLFEPKLLDLEILGIRYIALPVLYTVVAYAFFAFWVSLVREIIKDLQDMQGDIAFGCETLPIKIGIPKTKLIVAVLIVIQIALIGFIQLQYLDTQYYEIQQGRFLYIFIFIQLPMVYILYKLRRADKAADFQVMSNIVKFVMLAGILSMPVFQFII
ncbi:MAG: prenyltransferase [Chitinophagaceae bacterium]|nr:MAG: prenyltransferase [Chitinophagaceae bacterium]